MGTNAIRVVRLIVASIKKWHTLTNSTTHQVWLKKIATNNLTYFCWAHTPIGHIQFF